jgi:hypothetical protein
VNTPTTTCRRRSAPRTRRATTPRASWYSASGLALRQSTSFRGGTLRYLHVSEFGKICAKFPHKAREIVTGAFEAVAADCFVTIESTAEGRAGTSSTKRRAPRSSSCPACPLGLLDWKFFFFSWWRNPLYWLDPAASRSRSA